MQTSNQKGLYKNLTLALVLGKLLNTPVSLIIANILGPSLFGLNLLFNTIASYFTHAHLGTTTNLSREILFDLSEQKYEKVNYRVNCVINFYLLNSSVLSIIFSTICYLGFISSGLSSTLILLFPFFVVSQALNSLFSSLLKVYGQFNLFGKSELVLNIFHPLNSLLLTYLFSVNGLIASLIITNLFLVFYFAKSVSHEYKFILDFREIIFLSKTGMPMYLNKIIDVVFISIAVYFLTIYSEQRLLGIYGFAFTLFNIKKLPFVYPFVITKQRELTIDYNHLKVEDKREFILENTIKLFLMNIFTLTILLLVYLIVLNWLLIDYQESLELMIYLLPGLIIYNLRYLSFTFFDIEGDFHFRTILSGLSIIFMTLAVFTKKEFFLLLENLALLIDRVSPKGC